MAYAQHSPTTPSFHTVLVIGYVWPEPNSSAAGTRMMQLLHFFKCHATQIIFASPAQLGEHREPLEKLGITEQSITLNCNSFDTWVNNLQPQLVLFDRFMMEEQFGWRVEQQCPQCIRILDTEDLHSLREVRQIKLKHALKQGCELDLTSDDISDLYPAMAALDICQREIASIYRCDLSLMISNDEITLLTQAFQVPQTLLLHLPFMIDLDASVKSILPSFEQREHFVTIGNFRHAPNWDSVLWLKQSIWPKIRKLMPKAQLHIYGAYPAKKVTDLNNPHQGFHIKGWAEDAQQVLSSARVCLSPLRFGAGIKGKFTDAMLSKTPSITTTIGAESMLSTGTWPGIIADNEHDLAQAAVDLYQSQTLWHSASQKGHDIIARDYNKEHLFSTLAQRLCKLQTDLTGERSANFTGTLLRHHQHKSTKYMAQWIAAKNQSKNN